MTRRQCSSPLVAAEEEVEVLMVRVQVHVQHVALVPAIWMGPPHRTEPLPVTLELCSTSSTRSSARTSGLGRGKPEPGLTWVRE